MGAHYVRRSIPGSKNCKTVPASMAIKLHFRDGVACKEGDPVVESPLSDVQDELTRRVIEMKKMLNTGL